MYNNRVRKTLLHERKIRQNVNFNASRWQLVRGP